MNKYEVLPSNSFGLICRTCLLQTELFLIEEVSWEGIDLKEIILNWTSIDFDVSDQFPRSMCSKCIRIMYQTYHFLVKCKSSEWILKSICLREQNNAQSQNETCTESTDRDHVELDETKCVNSESDGDATIEQMPAEESSHEEDADLLQQIESIKSDITKMQADQKLQMSEITRIVKLRKTKSVGKDGSKDSPFMCNICSATFKNRQEIHVHRQTRHRRYFKFGCERCGNRYQQIQQLIAHIRIHTGEKPFKCNLCGKCFTLKSMLKRHSVRHIELQKAHHCVYCDKVFSSRDMLRRHENSHTAETLQFKEARQQPKDNLDVFFVSTDGGYQCNVCSKVLQSEKLLGDHFRLHGPKNHVCAVCGKSYISKERLALHMSNTHNRKKVFQCGKCPQTFAADRALKLHMRSHADIAKPFMCNICEKSFRHERNFRMHTKGHEGDSPYACNTCESGFSDFQSLKKHIITHA